MIKKLIVLSMSICVCVVAMGPKYDDDKHVCGVLKRLGRKPNWFEAARYKQTGRVRELLAAGQDVNAQDAHEMTALYHSCKRAPRELMQILLDAGADHRADDCIGFTPLHEACYWRRAEAVGILIACGAPLDLRAEESGDQDTPLHIACKCNDIRSVGLLLRAGARRDIKNSSGQIPIECTTNPEIKALFDTFSGERGGAAGAVAGRSR